MLGFKEYRNRLTEDTPDVEAGPENVLNHEKATSIQNQVNQVIDAWVTDLKRTLINPMTPLAQRRGVWDRFKNTMSNMWHGRYNQSNPYFWKNKLGDDLGATQEESFNPNNLSLADYKSLRDICESLEAQLNEDVPSGAENLRLVGMIDAKAKELKQKLMSIVGGTADNSSMSATPSKTQPEELDPTSSKTQPEELPANPGTSPTEIAPEEEEPDSKSKTFDVVIGMVQDYVRSGKMDKKEGEELLLRLKSPKDSIRQAASDDFIKRRNEIDGIKSSPTSSPESVKDSLFTPPSTGKQWNELTPEIQEKWNIYGGGTSHESGTKIDGCLNDHGIFKMPWIMRIGDPRRNVLIDQKKGVLPNSKKCNNKKVGSPWYNILTKSGRWEMEGDPIKNAMDLNSRIEKAKETRIKTPRSTTKSDIDVARNAAMNAEPEKSTSPSPELSTPEPISSLAATKPSLRDRVGSIGDEVPEVRDKFKGTGLSEPMHTSNDEPTDTPDPKNRVAGIDGANAIPNPTPHETKDKSVREIKKELIERIKKLTDEDSKEQLLRTLKTIKDRADLAELENEITAHEMISDTNFEWTATDMKNFYKKRLHERKGVPQHLAEQKKIENLSFIERTKYFKEQFQNR